MLIKSILSGKTFSVATKLNTPADYVWDMVASHGDEGLANFRKQLCGCRKTKNCECINTKYLIPA